MNQRTLAAAFPVTVPVLMGDWAYGGSGQYLGVSLLAAGASLPQAAFLTLMVNFRHLVYGLSMLEKFRGMGARKLYMIFSLTDETYALLSSAKAPEGVEKHDFFFAVALLDQSYWVLVGAEDRLLPALAIIVIALTLLRPRLEGKQVREEGTTCP